MAMKSEFVTIKNVPLRVKVWGCPLPSEIAQNPAARPQEMILFIPGNPGVTRFYEDFLSRLHDQTGKPVCILSHGGHELSPDNPALCGHEVLYDLRAQVERLKFFITKYLPRVRLTLVGHSIGCKMIMDAMRDADVASDTVRCYFLFPTIERMAESPNGRFFTFVYAYFLWLVLLGCHLFVQLPGLLRIVLLRVYFFLTGIPASNIPAALDLIHPEVVEKSLFLADDEMVRVRELDHDTMSAIVNKVKLYYGLNDGWVPLKYCEDLKRRYEAVDAEVCTQGYSHAFVLHDAAPMADMVSRWINGSESG